MSDSPRAAEPTSDVWASPLRRQRRRRLRVAGLIVGCVLLLAAIVVVATRGGELGRAFGALRSPSPSAIAVLVGSILGSIVLSTAVLLVLIRRFGRVGFGEMLRLVCASTLGNFLPLQPGLAGRVAYHHMVNRIPVQRTVLSIAEATLASAASVGLLLAALWVFHRLDWNETLAGRGWWWLPCLAGTFALPLLASRRTRPFGLALLARWLEVLLWALRAWACFSLVGETITPRAALAFACVAMAANLVPFIGNGLGIREWAIGILATPLAGVTVETGLAAELVGRAAEMIVFVPAGLLSSRGIMRRLRAAIADRPNASNQG